MLITMYAMIARNGGETQILELTLSEYNVSMLSYVEACGYEEMMY